MSRRGVGITLLLFLSLSVAPVRAQLVVIDPANLTQTILIAERTWDQYDQLRQEFDVIQRMAQKLGSLDRYRIPAMVITGHDPSRWPYGQAWLQALNSGDARGTAYFQNAVPLQQPRAADLSRLSASARRTFESQYATMEITDSVALMGAHQVALERSHLGTLQDVTQSLETDVLSSQSGAHEMTAVLDKISGASLIGARQRQARLQLMAGVVEQLLIDTKRARDTEATALNLQLTTWRDGASVNHAFASGTGDALRTWRQP